MSKCLILELRSEQFMFFKAFKYTTLRDAVLHLNLHTKLGSYLQILWNQTTQTIVQNHTLVGCVEKDRRGMIKRERVIGCQW